MLRLMALSYNRSTMPIRVPFYAAGTFSDTARSFNPSNWSLFTAITLCCSLVHPEAVLICIAPMKVMSYTIVPQAGNGIDPIGYSSSCTQYWPSDLLRELRFF